MSTRQLTHGKPAPCPICGRAYVCQFEGPPPGWLVELGRPFCQRDGASYEHHGTALQGAIDAGEAVLHDVEQQVADHELKAASS